MALPELAADAASIVIRGKFPSKVITPRWLVDQGLISRSDIESINYELLVPEVSIYTVDWVRCQFQTDSIQLTCHDPADFERLRDMAVGILRSLPEPEASVLGINRVVHFTLPDSNQWHRVGDRLANNGAWDAVLPMPGMRSVTIWGQRTDEYWGHVQVQVEPSNGYPQAIFIAYNDHYDLTTTTAWPASREEAMALNRSEDFSISAEKVGIALSILADEWGSSLKRSNEVIENVARQATK